MLGAFAYSRRGRWTGGWQRHPRESARCDTDQSPSPNRAIIPGRRLQPGGCTLRLTSPLPVRETEPPAASSAYTCHSGKVKWHCSSADCAKNCGLYVVAGWVQLARTGAVDRAGGGLQATRTGEKVRTTSPAAPESRSPLPSIPGRGWPSDTDNGRSGRSHHGVAAHGRGRRRRPPVASRRRRGRLRCASAAVAAASIACLNQQRDPHRPRRYRPCFRHEHKKKPRRSGVGGDAGRPDQTAFSFLRRATSPRTPRPASIIA